MKKLNKLLFILPTLLLGSCSFELVSFSLSVDESSSEITSNEEVSSSSFEESSYFSSESSKDDRIEVDGIKVPNFKTKKVVDFNGYGIPNINSDSYEKVYSALKEAGFTKVIALHDGRDNDTMTFCKEAYERYRTNKTELNQKAFLAAIDKNSDAINKGNKFGCTKAYKYKIKYIALIEGFYDLTNIFKNLSTSDYEMIAKRYLDGIDYGNYPAFAGAFMFDESSVGWYDAFKNVIDYYYEKGFNGQPCVNLLPATTTYASYESYINSYMEKLYPSLNYLSFDCYPIKKAGIESMHLGNLEITANALLKANRGHDLRTYIDATNIDTTYSSLKTANADYLRFQIYSAMAYGSREFEYFVISGNSDTTENTSRLINFRNYSTSPVYDYAKEVNLEVTNFGSVYSNFAWQSAMTYGSCAQFNALKKCVSGTTALPYFYEKKSNPTLIGNFSNGEQEAFMVVNYQNPSLPTSDSQIMLRFSDKFNAVLVYKDGEVHAYRHSD